MSTIEQMAATIARLEAENAELRKQVQAERDYLDYEKNKYQNFIDELGDDIASKILDTITLELNALDELAERMPENCARRVSRRVKRIRDYLAEFV